MRFLPSHHPHHPYSAPLIFKSPILTYRRQGTKKSGVIPEHHAIIFTETKSQNLKKPPREAKDETPLRNRPICVEPIGHREELQPTSRLNYAKMYTVEHNVKVSFIGKIHDFSFKELKATYKRIHRDPESEGAKDDRGGKGPKEDRGGRGDVHESNQRFRY